MMDKNEETKENIEITEEVKEKNEINKLKDKIKLQKDELEEKEDRIKRLMAEFENFKKRSEKERTGLYSSVMGDVIVSLLPVLDNKKKAAKAETKDEQYKNGIEMVLGQFKDVLKANNVIEIEAVGKKFDPSLHEAVSSVEDKALGEKEIKEEFRKGYMIGDRVLRHSLVVVAN